MSTGFIPILLACAAYGVLHSFLASMPVKTWVLRRFGTSGQRYFRLVYNILAGLIALPLLGLVALAPDSPLYTLPMPWTLLALALQAAGALGLVVAVAHTGAADFLGLSALLPARPAPEKPVLVTTGLYRWVRHPLYTCSLLLLWAMPVMSWNLLAAAIGLTGYILVGIQFEERKLLAAFGQEYAAYRARTPMLVPWVRR
jgi:methanethiol S-methyltransferase